MNNIVQFHDHNIQTIERTGALGMFKMILDKFSKTLYNFIHNRQLNLKVVTVYLFSC